MRKGGRAVAEIRTGARKSRLKGFCNPPVRKSSKAKLDDVEGKQARRRIIVQSDGSRRIADAEAMLRTAERPISVRQAAKGSV